MQIYKGALKATAPK